MEFKRLIQEMKEKEEREEKPLQKPKSPWKTEAKDRKAQEEAAQDGEYGRIKEALGDNLYWVTDDTTVGDYAKLVAERLGLPRDKVLKSIIGGKLSITENDKMAEVAGL